jgi:hypothetical protein
MTKNISLISLGPVKSVYTISQVEISKGHVLKKILLSGKSGGEVYNHYYPEAEIVHDLHSITEDHSIDLVIITGALNSNVALIAEVLKAGKNLRIIDRVSD